MDLVGHFDATTLARISDACGQAVRSSDLGLVVGKPFAPVGADGLYDPAAMRAAGWRMVGDDAEMRYWVKDA